jgi:hypothetical protein
MIGIGFEVLLADSSIFQRRLLHSHRSEWEPASFLNNSMSYATQQDKGKDIRVRTPNHCHIPK